MTTLYLAARAMGDFDSYACCSESRNWSKDDVSDASSAGSSSLNPSHNISDSSSNSVPISTSNAGAGAGSDCISDLEEVEVDNIVGEYDYDPVLSNSSYMESTCSRSSSGSSSRTGTAATSDMRHTRE